MAPTSIMAPTFISAPTNILRGDNAKPAAAARTKRGIKEPRIVVIRTGRIVIRARLRETATAERIWTQLPLYSTAEVWGAAVHFETHTETGREPSARQNVKAGEIGYWVEDDRVIIGYGMTPISKAGEIRMPSLSTSGRTRWTMWPYSEQSNPANASRSCRRTAAERLGL